MKLTQQEWHSIVHGLGVAATTFDQDAAQMRSDGQVRLAEQFERQAKEARAVIEKIEAAGLPY